jgi:iron complex transport system substrate-binding protein
LRFVRWMLAIACLCLFSGAVCADEYRTVVDSRGAAVQVPMEIERVVTISDGLIEGVITRLGEQDKIVGLGSSSLQAVSTYEFETVSGDTFVYENGMNPVFYLNSQFEELPLVAQYGVPPNYERLSSLDPDVVIMRAGSCTFWMDEDSMNKAIDTIESLGLPLVVTRGPNTYDEPDISTISDEIRIIGQVFDKEDDAAELAEFLENEISLVRERTADIADEEKPSVLILGLSPVSRNNGGAGDVMGLDTIESYFIENIVNARNAYQDNGYYKTVSAEHVLALNPDVIVLPTDWGYHPAKELYEAPYYQNLEELNAVKNKRVTALPWSPSNCEKRLEYPIDVMVIAKAAYPERFEDIDLGEWLLDFYMNVYNVDRETAIGIRSAQWMDWTVKEDD